MFIKAISINICLQKNTILQLGFELLCWNFALENNSPPNDIQITRKHIMELQRLQLKEEN